MIRIPVASVVALATVISTASAEIITVCASGCDYTSINAAIAAASDGDVIQLSAETYFEGEQIDTLGKAIVLRGVLDKAGEPASVLDGAGTHRVLNCDSGETDTTIFQNLLIQNGFILGAGGGIKVRNSSPFLANCIFRNNISEKRGGAVDIDGLCYLTLDGCAFIGNATGKVGGAIFQFGGSLSMDNCTFRNNSSNGEGGAVWQDSQVRTTWEDCTFTGNYARLGGGVMLSLSNTKLAGCEFANNSADRGGALVIFYDASGAGDYDGGPELVNCTIAFNRAGAGGGIWTDGDQGAVATLVNCTFAANLADAGSGIWNDAYLFPALSDCMFSECCQVDPPGSIIDLGGNDYDSWCEGCRANLDCRNGNVDASDLGYMLARWGTSDPQSDINGDGLVDSGDLGLLIAAWGPCS